MVLRRLGMYVWSVGDAYKVCLRGKIAETWPQELICADLRVCIELSVSASRCLCALYMPCSSSSSSRPTRRPHCRLPGHPPALSASTPIAQRNNSSHGCFC